jgi:hypothetical protein
MSSRIQTAEPQNKEPQNIEAKNITLLLSKTSAVRNSLFDIRCSEYKGGGIPQGRSEIINHTERDFRFKI